LSATPRQADRGVVGTVPSRSHARAPAGAARWLRALALVVLASGCVATQPAPPAPPRMPSQVLDAGAGSALGRVGATLSLPEGGVGEALPASSAASSLVPLAAGADAWAARLMLVEQAELGVDLQYYIFRHDASGRALLAALRRAADRGVRVRLLLDDWGAKPDLATLRALATYPRLEVRLYNPLAHAGSSLLSLLFDFERTQRRMHNKLLVADGRAAIVGGRNIGDEYFARRSGFEFGDLDMLVFGAVVPQFAAGFDRFWNEAPVAVLDGAADAATAAAPPPAVAGSPGDAGDDEGDAAWRGFAARLNARTVPRYRAAAQAVQDLPDKADPERDVDTHHLGQEISRVMGDVRSELLLVSPYFVPGEGGVEQLRALRRRGVRVVVVTNSLAATDVPAVHAGYARYRNALLEAGVELHELRGDTAPGRRLRQGVGSSRLSLHAKVMVVDRAQIFVGSMNIDPRSRRLNSENGIVVGSAALAGGVAEGLERALAVSAWRVTLQQGRLAWQGQRDGAAATLDEEPGAGLWLRLQAVLLSWLPIEGLL
jgi:cardiolipin synthase C